MNAESGIREFSPSAADLYLTLLEKSLTRSIIGKQLYPFSQRSDLYRPSAKPFYKMMDRLLSKRGLVLAKFDLFDPHKRQFGLDWPADAETMVGLTRLRNIRQCVEDVLKNNVEGDLIETGVWRGGSTILMRGVLKAFDVRNRKVFVADSFEGLPEPDLDKYPMDKSCTLWQYDYMQASLDMVKANFAKYDLLDDQVQFLVGWFKDTLPTAPLEKIAVMRLDGDYYQSNMESLVNLYPKLSSGGYCIIDDYFSISVCKQAIDDYRSQNNIVEQLIQVDQNAVYWQKQ